MDIKRCKTLEAYVTPRKESDFRYVRSLLLDLPLALTHEIFSRLHTETLFSCRCVCKTLFEILTDPEFTKLRLSKSPYSGDGLVILDTQKSSDILFVYDYNGHDKAESRPCQTLSMPMVASQYFNYTVNLVGSCNGLLCMRFFSINFHTLYYVCNPVLGQFLPLPPVVHVVHSYQTCAFGFCPKTNKYKVIRFFGASTLCNIHTLGTDNWQTISCPPPPRTEASFYSSPSGILHWVIMNFTVSKMICSFDWESEQVSIIPTPAHLNDGILRELGLIQTGSLGGLFYLSYVRDKFTIEVCVMKEYGVKESWTKEFVIDLRLISGLQERGILIPIHLMDNGDFLFKCRSSSIVSLNLYKGTITDLVAKNVLTIGVKPFYPSFVSLKDISFDSGKDVEVVQRKMGRNLWSDKGYQFIP